MNSQQLINLQDEGFEMTSNQANLKIQARRKDTPQEYHYLFRSYLRHSASGYLWGWILK